ncbi:unnamed protein product, partial [Acidithrix sp. C25]
VAEVFSLALFWLYGFLDLEVLIALTWDCDNVEPGGSFDRSYTC